MGLRSALAQAPTTLLLVAAFMGNEHAAAIAGLEERE